MSCSPSSSPRDGSTVLHNVGSFFGNKTETTYWVMLKLNWWSHIWLSICISSKWIHVHPKVGNHIQFIWLLLYFLKKTQIDGRSPYSNMAVIDMFWNKYPKSTFGKFWMGDVVVARYIGWIYWVNLYWILERRYYYF